MELHALTVVAHSCALLSLAVGAEGQMARFLGMTLGMYSRLAVLMYWTLVQWLLLLSI